MASPLPIGHTEKPNRVDASLITMTEMVENTRRICNAVNILVIVDGDTGFGNAYNARRTVQLMIQAGVVGLFIEDQVAPKRCGFVAGKEIIPMEEVIGKFQALLIGERPVPANYSYSEKDEDEDDKDQGDRWLKEVVVIPSDEFVQFVDKGPETYSAQYCRNYFASMV